MERIKKEKHNNAKKILLFCLFGIINSIVVFVIKREGQTALKKKSPPQLLGAILVAFFLLLLQNWYHLFPFPALGERGEKKKQRMEDPFYPFSLLVPST